MGSGATAAGRPSYAPSYSNSGAVTALEAGAIPATPTPYSPARPQAPRISVPVVSKPSPVQPESTPSLELPPAYGLGYMFKRVSAYLLDSAFNLALCAGALSVALWKQDMSPELLVNPSIVLVASLFLGVFNWAITTAQEVAFGTSLGKRLFGLALNGSTSAIFLRAFFFLPSACFAGIGLFWSLFDKRKRCWHDLVVDLQPIEIARF